MGLNSPKVPAKTSGILSGAIKFVSEGGTWPNTEKQNNNSKKLTLKFDIRKLRAERILSLKSELRRFKGDKPICFDIIDSEKSLKLTLNSRKQKVGISPELLDHLDNNDWIYKLN